MVTFNEKLHVFTAPADMLPLEIINGEDVARLIEMAVANFDFRGGRHAHHGRLLDRDGAQPAPMSTSR